jgi:hypothetical protein
MSRDEAEMYFSGKLEEKDSQVEGESFTELDAPYEGQGWCGNFRGFIQYRKMIPMENRHDTRVVKK